MLIIIINVICQMKKYVDQIGNNNLGILNFLIHFFTLILSR